jgi:hypothetical protein
LNHSFAVCQQAPGGECESGQRDSPGLARSHRVNYNDSGGRIQRYDELSVRRKHRECPSTQRYGGGAIRIAKVGQTLTLAAIGMAGGLVTAIAVTRFAANLLYGISPADPLTFILIAVLLLFVSLVAGYFPARRATKIDPMIALRSE